MAKPYASELLDKAQKLRDSVMSIRKVAKALGVLHHELQGEQPKAKYPRVVYSFKGLGRV
jgi:hypothetical protein